MSDTASKDTTADKSGPIIQNVLQARGFQCQSPIIVPDDEGQIKISVLNWIHKGDIDWIITTGGTGFSVRDKTPEVVLEYRT